MISIKDKVNDKHYDIKGTSCRKSKISYNVEYERRLGDYLNPDYIDIKVNTYINHKHFSIYFWIDTHCISWDSLNPWDYKCNP